MKQSEHVVDGFYRAEDGRVLWMQTARGSRVRAILTKVNCLKVQTSPECVRLAAGALVGSIADAYELVIALESSDGKARELGGKLAKLMYGDRA